MKVLRKRKPARWQRSVSIKHQRSRFHVLCFGACAKVRSAFLANVKSLNEKFSRPTLAAPASPLPSSRSSCCWPWGFPSPSSSGPLPLRHRRLKPPCVCSWLSKWYKKIQSHSETLKSVQQLSSSHFLSIPTCERCWLGGLRGDAGGGCDEHHELLGVTWR